MAYFAPQGTFFGLGLMSTSLDAFQMAENVTSDDISNVNTPGASRQNVLLTEAPPIVGTIGSPAHVPGTVGDGVTISTIQRIHSNSYDELFRGASSSQNYYQTEQQQLQAVQSSFGDPNSGINAQYTAFQAAINQLVAQGASGQSTAINANVLSQAQALCNSLNSSAATVSQQEAQVMQQAGTTVTTVNGILDQIAALNGQIRASTAAGDSPNTYADQRDELIDQLSQYLTTQTSIQPDGSTLVTVNGQALVNDTVAYHLSQPLIGTASNGAPIFKIDFSSTPPPNASNNAGVPLGSGQLAAMADLYNNKLVVYGQQLDQFASSVANEVNRITTAGYTAGGAAGSPLFQPIVQTLAITAGNIKCGITDPAQLPTALVNTEAGSLVVPLNSANNTVDTFASFTNNASLANPPAGALAGNLTVTVDGVTETFAYTTGVGGNADNINDFVTSFNAAHMGVTASFDPSAQKIVFARDPNNEDLALRGAQQASPETPDFTIADTNWAAGTPATSLLGVLGAQNLGTAGGPIPAGVNQNATNAFGPADNGVSRSLVAMFNSNVGVPALEFTSPAAAAANAPITVQVPPNSFYSNKVQVGQVLTIDATKGGGPPQENVTVSAISFNGGVESITFTPTLAHAANFTITSAQTQTLGQFYGNFITQVGLDAQTATTGNATQTSLANNINQVRQSISGINIDEETQNLIKYQSAYTAAAHTINVLNQILQTTITSLGVGQ